LEATLYVTLPGPVPLELPVIVTHETGLEAVHGHPIPVDTDTEPFDAPLPSATLVGEML
jgi:hypothetical protein